jgi:hypothetical protein
MNAEDRLADFVAKVLADGLPPERLKTVKEQLARGEGRISFDLQWSGAPAARGTEQLPSK